ncbi:MAG: S8 family serine peptidase [Phycisphaerales bacterium]|nr:S8 family serine peptidase [Phycisphaerales bacterium]
MRKLPTLSAIGLIALSTGALASFDQPLVAAVDPAGPLMQIPDRFVENELIVVFDEPTTVQVDAVAPLVQATGVASLDDLGRKFGVSDLRKQFPGSDTALAKASNLPDLSGYYVVRFDPNLASLDQVMSAYAADPFVVRVEPIGIHPIYAVPNDGNYASQWHLNQTNDRDIDAPEAWNIGTGGPSTIVAVLDTGVRYYHKDLGGSAASSANPTATDGNMWVNSAEKSGTAGVDDDGNGYVDDWVGWDFVTGLTGCWSGEDCATADNDPRDFNGHGTHCAGNVGAINNNGYATASAAGGWGNGTLQPTANGTKVMAMRIGYSASYLGSEAGFVRMDFAAGAFYYAANKGARIASCSWGSSNSGGIDAAATYFINSGGLIFKAAGNSNNQTADYLCARTDVYSVAATDQNDVKSSFSSYGTWVDISAPGSSIMSSYHNHNDAANDYVASLSGTSMATPIVASVAAAVWAQNPTWTRTQVWDRVRTTTDNISAQNPSYNGLLGSGRVNLYNALNTGGGGGNTAPTVSISSPANGTTVAQGTSVTFTGSATDTQDGNISASLIWTSSINGQIGAGASFSTSSLSAGTHTITASVTDSGGLSGSASISLTVQAPSPPAAPSGVSVTDLGGGVARVNWVDNSNNETSFEIQRQTRVGGSWSIATTVGTVGANVTTFNNTAGLGRHRYRVRAVNSAGNSAYTGWVQITLR